ncbi:hypothetical protein CC78DRAFT_99754 [Lojkania enalia]|uniref:GAR domain-containing protein n=1 Tax=Lojkania enalia TaxID=147567 RepID=A0A9P4JYB0_9PLEO|nr:hypothetical protein CC78DRAFT_99754 [Didymosphaeria enalia]
MSVSGLSSPLRFLPPISPRRPPSPAMSPVRRMGRPAGSSEENYLRDLSPSTTLRAFAEKPMPYDTTLDEYKIFACIDTLTPAERDLGHRVAKAAQRLKSWCEEIEQWGWSGTFEQPSDEFREKRRKSLEGRIREHVKDYEAMESIAPLEYWGSLLSVEVQAHEARLDEISDELLTLDIEELKENVLDIHGVNRSRPSSAGYEAVRQNYTPMDDFSFLITQTLLSALPHHFQLKDRLRTWTARVSILREAPRYLDDLKTMQKAVQLGWEATEPPADGSDDAFAKWKEAIETITVFLQGKVSNLGRRLDRMLDTLEGRDDCLPDDWIDIFEDVEAGFGRWVHESRKRVIELEVRRKMNSKRGGVEGRRGASPERPKTHSNHGPTLIPQDDQHQIHEESTPAVTATETLHVGSPSIVVHEEESSGLNGLSTSSINHGALETPAVRETSIPKRPHRLSVSTINYEMPESVVELDEHAPDDSIFEEGDTVVHNDLLDEEENYSSGPEAIHSQISEVPSDLTTLTSTEEQTSSKDVLERPRTPRSRSGSVDSISSSISFASSPPGVDDSPSIRKQTARVPRPALNASMPKRRNLKKEMDDSMDSTPPWPPTQFSKQLYPTSADDLERKISDILTTVPAHIRLTGANTTEVKSRRGITNKGSRGYLHAGRSTSGMKSPELTLSPAKPDFDSANIASGRKSATATRGDNDIKVYHLTQPGKEHPQRLYIRRVGENGERVMVRVGGGWADLGEYLRQYAEHHGRRTVSEGKFEILGLEVKNPDERSPRPESAMSKRDRRFSGGANSNGNTPKKSGTAAILKDEQTSHSPDATSTPNAGSGETSAPSTSSSRHSWTGNELSLAGPKVKKKGDLSEEKKDWIEGMLKQARNVSGNMTLASTVGGNKERDGADSRSESKNENRAGPRKSDFGDLGKVGGTKRVFMRGGALNDH